MCNQNVAVSIIVPVYNVSNWLDICLESVENQTFRNFELILIDDGSTDDSLHKCKKWAEKDKRIKIISKGNEGPSIARNVGIKVAKGEYLSFIDSDDWVADSFIEKLYSAAVSEGADMAECDVYRVDNRTGEMTYRSCSGNIGIKYTKKEHMKYGYTSIWKCLFKKELFDKYNITFPNCHSEARAVYAFIVAVSNKIANVEEGLYFYRRFRENSLSGNPRKNNGDEHALGLRAFEALIEKFSSAGIYDEYKDILEEIIKYKLSDILATSFYRRTKDEYDMLLNKYNCFISEKIPGAINYEYIILGGYNLNRILWNMNVIHSPYNRFNFSSIISVMHPVKNITIEHKNIYRKIMVNRDVQSDFWDIYEYSNASHIFIDLVEERFDILKLNEGYITKSDAWDNSEKCPCQGTICRLSAECDALWKNSFDDFVKKARTVKNNVKIIVVENFLALSYGDILCQTEYKDVESIREINKKLKSYYSYINEKYPELIMIKTSECDNYFTDDKYEYGVQPSHLNDWVNRKITEMIEERMEAI